MISAMTSHKVLLRSTAASKEIRTIKFNMVALIKVLFEIECFSKLTLKFST